MSTEGKQSSTTTTTIQQYSRFGVYTFLLVGMAVMISILFITFYAEDTIMPWYLGKPPGRTVQTTPLPVIVEPKPQPLPPVPVSMAAPPDEPAMPVRANLALWLRADAMPASVKNGDLIIAVPDASPLRNDAKQQFPIHRPRFIQNAIAGKPAMRFDGYNSFFYFEDGLAKGKLDKGSAAPVIVDEKGNNLPSDGFTRATVFAVWSRPTFCESRQYPDGSSYQRLYSSGALGPDYTRGGMYAIVHDPKVNEPVMLEPNKYYAPITPPRLSKAVFETPVDVRNFWIGRQNTGAEHYFTGDLAEILVFTRVLSKDEQEQVERYLRQKYALH
jgi:hypothetical protein